MAAVLPYLGFSGNCGEAFDFYASVFGVEPSMNMQYKDMPGNHSPAEANHVMHVALPLCNGSMLMGADRPAGMGPTVPGNNFSVSLGTGSEEETRCLFDGLSAGGQVAVPLHDAPWGALFGMFTDKFGVQWMVNFDRSRTGTAHSETAASAA